MFLPTRCKAVSFCSTFFFVLFCCFAQAGKALAQTEKPSNVSALIYSSSALELFWTPVEGTVVEVSRNGVDFVELDARSLFQHNLSNEESHRYVLRTVASDGTRSEPTVLILSTENFQLPIKRVYPVGSESSVESISPPPPIVVSSETTTNSTTTPSSNQPVVVEPEPEPEPIAVAPTVQAVSSPATIVQGSDNCIARNIAGLTSCVNNASAYARIDIAQDLQCGSNCCPSGKALINLSNVSGLEINGHGHTLLRKQNQRQCSLLDLSNVSNVSINNLSLDDDISVAGCQVGDQCPRMVHIKNSDNVAFSQTHVSHGKGYAFYVQKTNGFVFENGSLHNSGVLGMYIGHGSNASRNIRIIGSTFSDNQTNGLALLGVVGNSVNDNLVANNVFVRNHRKGQWAVAPRFGTGFTGGGQLYVAEASNVTVRNNVIKDGYCDNCFIQRVARSGISGIELGIPNEASLRNIVIRANDVSNLDGFGISQNTNSSFNNVSVVDNLVLNSTSGLHFSGAQSSGNRVIDTDKFQSFESESDFNNAYTSSVQCSAGGTVRRQCGLGSQFGQCAVELKLASADCGDVKAELVGQSINVSAGQSVVASGWVKNPRGRWCVQFTDASGNRISEACESINDAGSSDVQAFVGLPQIDARAPSGSRSARLRVYHTQTGASMLLDDLKLSAGSS